MREQREKERELKELDRDIRTVFAYNLPLKADERDLFEFFSKAGPIEDVRIIMDRNTRKSKGFAYIEYTNKVGVPDWHSHSLVFLQWGQGDTGTLTTMPENKLRGVLTGELPALQADIVTAMALTGQILMGQAVMVKSSEVRALVTLDRRFACVKSIISGCGSASEL